MKKLLTAGAITALGCGLAFGGGQQAGQPGSQQEAGQQEARQQQQEQQEFGMRPQQHQEGGKKLSQLEEADLVGQDGEQIGQFEDIVVDLETGAVSFIIVAGDDEQRRAVPISAVQVRGSDADLELVLNVDQQEFEQAPGIERDEIAQLGQEDRAREIFEHFGEDWEAHQQQQMEFAAPPRREQEEQEERPDQSPGLETRQEEPGQQREFGSPGEREEGPASPGQAPQHQQQDQQEMEFGSPQQRSERQDPAGSAQQEEARAAGQQQQQQQGYGAAQREQEKSVKLGRDLSDATIQDQNQQEIGQINDLIVDLEEGYASFVIIESAEGHFAVSPRALQPEAEESFSLNITREELEQAESISDQDLQTRAQQQRQMETAQLRESPEVFRYEEEQETAVFGAPQREQREQPEAERGMQEREQRQQQQQTQPESQSERL